MELREELAREESTDGNSASRSGGGASFAGTIAKPERSGGKVGRPIRRLSVPGKRRRRAKPKPLPPLRRDHSEEWFSFSLSSLSSLPPSLTLSLSLSHFHSLTHSPSLHLSLTLPPSLSLSLTLPPSLTLSLLTVANKEFEDRPLYDDLRAEAALHAKLRSEAFQKAAHARSCRQGDVAVYYAQKVRDYTSIIYSRTSLNRTSLGQIIVS